MEQKTKISKKNAEKLERAYMDLYNTFVRIYQQQRKTNGQSWHDAIREMNNIIMLHKAQKETNPVIGFLFDLFYEHKSTVAKKCMISPNRNHVAPKIKHYEDGLQIAIMKFEQTIKIAMRQNESAESVASVSDVLPSMPKSVYTRPFYEWLENNISNAEIEKLKNDPRQFEILYNKYIKRQKYR